MFRFNTEEGVIRKKIDPWLQPWFENLKKSRQRYLSTERPDNASSLDIPRQEIVVGALSDWFKTICSKSYLSDKNKEFIPKMLNTDYIEKYCGSRRTL